MVVDGGVTLFCPPSDESFPLTIVIVAASVAAAVLLLFIVAIAVGVYCYCSYKARRYLLCAVPAK